MPNARVDLIHAQASLSSLCGLDKNELEENGLTSEPVDTMTPRGPASARF